MSAPTRQMKDSGMNRPIWVTNLPSHWRVEKLKHLASLRFSNVDKHTKADEIPVRLCNYTDVYYNDLITSELDFMQATATREEIAAFELHAGDVIVTKDSETWNDIAVPAYVPENFDNVICGYHLAQIRPDQAVINGKYLFFTFNAAGIRDQFHIAANGVTRYGLPQHALKTALFPLPSRAEQDAIVAFLDERLADIDRYIAAKQRLIELLAEQKAAIINRAVTRGLNPAAPLKDSGKPEVKLGFYVELLPGFAFASSRYSTAKEDIRLLRGVNISPGAIRWEDTVRWPEEEYNQFVDYHLKPEDLVIGMDRPWISSGIRVAKISKEDTPSLLLQRVARLRAKPGLLQDFLELLLISQEFYNYFEPILTGISVPHISGGQINNFRFSLPSTEEQKQICTKVHEASIDIRLAIKKASEEIELMQELRTSLIAEAVTGKLDARGKNNVVTA